MMPETIRGEMRPLGYLIELWASSLGIRKRLLEWRACCLWKEVVGEAIARHATAVGVQEGVLVVRVQSAPWRNELFFMKSDIVDKVNRKVGHKVIKDIRFIQ